MNMYNKKALLEGIKEFIRMVLISILPVAISQLESGGNMNYRAVIVAGIIAVLRALDKWSHERDVKSPLDLKGMDNLIY